MQRFLNGIEWAGNKLPDPAFLFVWAILITVVASHFLASMTFEEIDPRIQAAAPQTSAATPEKPADRTFFTLFNGRRFRVFNVVDEFTREAPTTVVVNSISGARVARELDLLATHRGKPATIVSDNGPEFISKTMDAWAYGAGVKLHLIRPVKPVENAYVESFNGHFRDECLNMH